MISSPHFRAAFRQPILFAVLALMVPSLGKARGTTRIVGYGSVGYSLLVSASTPEGTELPYGDSFGGASKKGTFRNLTRFGLNLTHVAAENTSFLIQLAANGSDLFHGTDEEYQFNVRANLAGIKLSYDLLEVMLGILPTGYFMISDTMQMGATYLWAQPPKVFYRVGDSSNVVGARMRKSFDIEDDLLTLEVIAGELLYRKWYDSRSEIDSRSSFIYSLGFLVETGDHNGRLVYSIVPEMSYTRSEYRERVLSPGTPPVKIALPGGCRTALVDAVNAGYDGYITDEFRVQAEYVLRRTHFRGCYGSQLYAERMRFQEQAGYVALAYSMGSFTPRLLILKQNITAELDDAATYFASRYPVFQRPFVRAAYLKDAGYRGREKTDSFGLGLNYQLTPFIVAKAELEHYVAPDKNIRGYQMPVDSSATLFNIAIDYVF